MNNRFPSSAEAPAALGSLHWSPDRATVAAPDTLRECLAPGIIAYKALDIWTSLVVRGKRKKENCASTMGMSFRRNPSICTIVRILRRRHASVRKLTKIRVISCVPEEYMQHREIAK